MVSSQARPEDNQRTYLPLTTYSSQAQAFRAERDTFGDLQVPADRYWGAQTQR